MTIKRTSKIKNINPQVRKCLMKRVITPKMLKNYLDGNSLQDWLEKYGDNSQIIRRVPFPSGVKFQKYVVNQLISRVGADGKVVQLDAGASVSAEASVTGLETIKSMTEGAAIITNAVLIHRSAGLSCVSDMLVRSDYISRLFPLHSEPVPPGGCKFSDKWYYVPVSIRIGTNTFRTHKTQSPGDYWVMRMYIENSIVNYYQGTEHDISLMVGSRYVWINKTRAGRMIRNDDVFDKPLMLHHDRKISDAVFRRVEKWLDQLDAPEAKDWKPETSIAPDLAAMEFNYDHTPWAGVLSTIATKQRALNPAKVQSALALECQSGRIKDNALYMVLEAVPDGMFKVNVGNEGNEGNVDSYRCSDWVYLAGVGVKRDGVLTIHQLGLGLMISDTTDIETLMEAVELEIIEELHSILEQEPDMTVYVPDWLTHSRLIGLSLRYPEFGILNNHMEAVQAIFRPETDTLSLVSQIVEQLASGVASGVASGPGSAAGTTSEILARIHQANRAAVEKLGAST